MLDNLRSCSGLPVTGLHVTGHKLRRLLEPSSLKGSETSILSLRSRLLSPRVSQVTPYKLRGAGGGLSARAHFGFTEYNNSYGVKKI